MRRAARAFVAAVVLACVNGGAALAALEWPLAQSGIAATFGTQAQGRIVTGLALAAEGGLVRAAGDGELVFAAEEGVGPSGLPSALGTFMVVEHERGMAAVYAHLSPGTAADRAREIRSGDPLGATGASGWAEGPGMLLQVYDRQESRWVNPLLLMPSRADQKPPVIRSLTLMRGGESFVLGEARVVRQGTYLVALTAADAPEAAWIAGPLAPFSMRLTIDGTVAAKGTFDVARAEGGEVAFFSESPRPASGLRGPGGGYVLVERLFTRGKVLFEANVEDASGNRRSASWSVVVE